MMKQGVRTIGIDDGPFKRAGRGDVLVVGAVYRGGTIFDGLLTTTVRKDGWNATDKILSMLMESKFLPQLHYMILDGIALGGFNIIDIDRLHRETGLKILVSVRKMPKLKAVKNALNHLTRPEKRWRLILAAGELYAINNLHCQLKGMELSEAKQLLKLTCTQSHIPEPLRAAHLIAGGLITGQSGRRA
ncbi:MAG: DUF99 family protein [Proteobacteria bacterium]|nr:DUF99 family protein [Pseudomonadota bacterium]MCP4600237.1 DUF99 family protein [Pseudomonadota bacterium]